MRDVAIIGGGLSGLAAADILHRSGIPVTVYEARIRFGGRALSRPSLGGAVRYDLGPSWIWPHNARVLGLASRFGIPIYDQYADGNLVFQDQAGAVRRDLTMSTMAGALRVTGGVQALTDALRSTLPSGSLKLNTRINAVRDMGTHVELAGLFGYQPFQERFSCVILAVPPRVIARDIALGWNGGQHVSALLGAVPTWMAGHAKFTAVYDTAFWRGLGLNGDAISHTGPLTEIHDASPPDLSQGALFGFLTPGPGWSAEQVIHAALSQLVMLFGAEAGAPRDILYQNWATEVETATQMDHAPLTAHPQYGLPAEVAQFTPPRVQYAGTELAETEGGFLEGAIEAAERAAHGVLDGLKPSYGWG